MDAKECLMKYAALKLELLDLRELHSPYVEEKQREMDLIERAIDNIEDPLYRVVLRRRYIICKNGSQTPWREIAIGMYGDDDEKDLTRVQRLHKKALKCFAAAFKD